ncbi:quinone-dependent dihydroorotate dehydrogenase [Corynebacterium poyangense]|uniref:Dihydroorotate dehydrogenase (quinone) n=1 Tax=Corynebacterium poyangense TaxID=2684405 RepID=A0A7H0SNW3_9CORY|nr:quinone-dependent dihydroorotate dehydrogenase [Corynebacterium poyangense]MBZ8177794.1 quinone-dependent dihydroorotate dehydrogenase [Corynebacterium poyangense]QNQ90238.1 quinone-dependent dihydroorotate dehydrogenase [Corynebacterium poyangense]
MVSLRRQVYNLALKGMFRIPPERIHGMISDSLRILQLMRPVHRVFNHIVPVRDPILSQEVFGVTFPRPLGLAAGFDKNADSPDVWSPVGFGYAELGTVTASPQPGNPAPRLFRLPKDKAILNRMGFNNDGAAEVAMNLRRRTTEDVIGINIGKTKVVDPDGAADDYRRSAMLLGSLADYLVINVSSPNTPGLRDLQAVDSLRPIIQAVQSATTTPILVKIAPDLADEDIDDIADLAVERGLAGIVATNTTISRENLLTDAKKVSKMGDGGISGPPVAQRSLDVLKRLYERVGDHLVLISVGGISTPQQAWERIAHGATLLQGYTGLIYGGPDWIRWIHQGIAHQLRVHGFGNISDAVGCGLDWRD